VSDVSGACDADRDDLVFFGNGELVAQRIQTLDVETEYPEWHNLVVVGPLQAFNALLPHVHFVVALTVVAAALLVDVVVFDSEPAHSFHVLVHHESEHLRQSRLLTLALN